MARPRTFDGNALFTRGSKEEKCSLCVCVSVCLSVSSLPRPFIEVEWERQRIKIIEPWTFFYRHSDNLTSARALLLSHAHNLATSSERPSTYEYVVRTGSKKVCWIGCTKGRRVTEVVGEDGRRKTSHSSKTPSWTLTYAKEETTEQEKDISTNEQPLLNEAKSAFHTASVLIE